MKKQSIITSGNRSEPAFLIFGLGRSGSSVLEDTIRMGINKGDTACGFLSGKDEYVKRINSGRNLKEKKRELFRILDELHKDENYIGLKSNIKNLDFTSEWIELTNGLFEYYDKVVLNFRMNILKSVISFYIANEIGNFEVRSKKERERVLSKGHSWTIDINNLKRKLQHRRKAWNTHLRSIENTNISTYPLNYKRLYGIEDVDYRINEIKKVIEWLGYEFDDSNLQGIRHLLNPDHKSNSEKTYKMIENIDEINRKLGPDFGYLY